MLGNNPWDTSAGVLIAPEAGVRVRPRRLRTLTTVPVRHRGSAPTLEADLMAVLQAVLDRVKARYWMRQHAKIEHMFEIIPGPSALLP